MGKSSAFEKIKAGLEEALEIAQASNAIDAPDKPLPNRSLTNFTTKPTNDLTPNQRQALSIARQLDREGRPIWIQTVADRRRITHGAARDRLDRVASRGYLLRTAPGYYELAEAASAPIEDPTVLRVEYRDGVKVTIYAPAHAQGSTTFPRWPMAAGAAFETGGRVRARRHP